MDDVMNHAVPPIAEHDADREAVGDMESHVQPNGNQDAAGQNGNADPERCPEERQGRAVVLGVHGGEVSFLVEYGAM
jgi:hypothetical protein